MEPIEEPGRPGDIFDRSAIHTTAAWVVLSELRRYPLRWSDTGQPADDHTWYFVHSLVRQFMAYGFATWRNYRGALQTVDDVIVKRTRPGGRWRVEQMPDATVSTRGWRIHAFVHPPVWMLRPSHWDWPSPLQRSLPHLRVVRLMQENWLSRDAHNSRPSAFTRIELQGHMAGSTANGAAGSNHGHALHLPVYNNATFAPGSNDRSTATTFQQLINDRHDAIRQLSEKSTLEREAIMGAVSATPLDNVGKLVKPAEPALHEEHVITDGKAFTETKTLLSTADGRFHYDRARHNVFHALGIPPQATGETVNSERTAAAAATFDTAMSHFLSTVRMYRAAVSAVLREATTMPDGAHIAFGTGLSSIQLDRVMPYLKPAKAKRLLSQVYELDESFFDERRIGEASSVSKRPSLGRGPQQQLNNVSATKSQSKRYKETE